MVMDVGRLLELKAEGTAELVEVFSSIQGEGPRVGQRHLFVRTVHCDIHCAYCDTPLCHAPRATARILKSTFGGTDCEVPNPLTMDRLRDIVLEALDHARHAAVSFTGGEPLLQPWVVQSLAKTVREAGASVLLETDGNLPEAFADIAQSVDILSMDWKLPSATREVERAAEHRRMLQSAVSLGLEIAVKAVFVSETTREELNALIETLAGIDPKIPLILQPCTPFRMIKAGPSMEHALSLHHYASERLLDVRLLPQVHRLLRLP